MVAYDNDRRILALLKPRLPAAPVIFDVGASNGVWTQGALEVFPGADIALFDPTHYPDLDGLLRCRAKQLKYFPFAIGSYDGKHAFHVMPDACGSTALEWAEASRYSTLTYVDMRTLDSIVLNKELPAPDLIKMDIQGGELRALEGARNVLPHVTALMLETWITRGYGVKTPLLCELLDFLRPLGFRMFDVGEQHRTDGELYALDVCFARGF